MTSESQFTSVQWDRDDQDPTTNAFPDPIAEESNNPDQHTSGNESEKSASTGHFHEQPSAPPEPAIEAKQEPKSFTTTTEVTSPARDTDAAQKPFVTYLVTTATNDPSIIRMCSTLKKPSPNQDDTTPEGSVDNLVQVVAVRRRYGDFKFLYECLSADYPQHLVPPLPSKSNFKYLTGDTFHEEFITKRLQSLNRFVHYINQHQYLSQSSIFKLFVSDSADWLTFQKNLSINNSDEGTSVVSRVVNEDMLTETVMNYFTSSKHKKETNKEIIEISDKLKKLYENLQKLDRLFAKLNKRHAELATDYGQYATQVSRLGSTDQSDISNNFADFSQSLSCFSTSWHGLHKYIDESFLTSLKDCSKYILGLTNLIELQHNKHIDLQVLQEYLDKTRQELANMGGTSHRPPPAPVASHNGGIVNNTAQLIKDTLSTSATPTIGSTATEGKIKKLQQRVSQLEEEIEAQTAIANDLTNKVITEEYPNWDRFNGNELKASMLALCDKEIEFYKGLVDNWKGVEDNLTQRLQQLESGHTQGES
ncbi:Sorting nexin-4 [Meyerozyma sp. JA9]|nr:Sorting nexin-4 [Meyerozyma sp. JA9]